MAGLPSVVLGFLAAVIFAPFVQAVVPAVLAGLATLPLALLLGAYLWQLLPQRIALRFADGRRFACIVAMLPVGVAAAAWLGPWVERWLFAGDVEQWLAGERGGALGGWMLLFVPLAGLLVALANGRALTPWLRARSFGWGRAACARADLVRFAFNVVATVVIALALSAAVAGLGFDARGSFVDTYVQRNALVVGFVMGFAIIPIIYTIAEDALTSVPGHLRLASLAAGATPWQTAVHVILPTAASGLFSAVMVGLGRAVGETMIVLMATGNTPVMNWNVFSGFRTLSANIATELPEAVKNSTHYRTLFLAALLLFAMTFAVNTAAEVVRQRFRRRAFQL
ncbi:MAG: ABC transporter permease subunit [Planctomycetes bacterium]|nr:ABC transporter permease subunit [Planctomycetota bacterium]